MKKTVKQIDGTEITFEGTVEELAELETRVKTGQTNEAPKRKKRLLNEAQLAQIGELIDQKILQHLAREFDRLTGTPQIIPWIQPAPPITPYPQWPGYPMPYIGDPFPGLLGGGFTVTCDKMEISTEFPVKTSCGNTLGIMMGTDGFAYNNPN